MVTFVEITVTVHTPLLFDHELLDFLYPILQFSHPSNSTPLFVGVLSNSIVIVLPARSARDAPSYFIYCPLLVIEIPSLVALVFVQSVAGILVSRKKSLVDFL
jgi:hypothetical protein